MRIRPHSSVLICVRGETWINALYEMKQHQGYRLHLFSQHPLEHTTFMNSNTPFWRSNLGQRRRGWITTSKTEKWANNFLSQMEYKLYFLSALRLHGRFRKLACRWQLGTFPMQYRFSAELVCRCTWMALNLLKNAVTPQDGMAEDSSGIGCSRSHPRS